MFKCPICEKEYINGRQLHGHMLKAHQEEYKKHGNKVANFHKGKDRPAGFRLLNKANVDEANAYNDGFRYTDGEYVYTSDEVKEKGWIQ